MPTYIPHLCKQRIFIYKGLLSLGFISKSDLFEGNSFVVSLSDEQNFHLKKIFFFSFRSAPMAYGSSQARDQIGAAVASLCHSNSDTRS